MHEYFSYHEHVKYLPFFRNLLKNSFLFRLIRFHFITTAYGWALQQTRRTVVTYYCSTIQVHWHISFFTDVCSDLSHRCTCCFLWCSRTDTTCCIAIDRKLTSFRSCSFWILFNFRPRHHSTKLVVSSLAAKVMRLGNKTQVRSKSRDGALGKSNNRQ